MAEEEKGLGPVSGSKITFVDLLVAGGVKYFSERLMAPYIGNGNVQSGIVKIVGAKYLGKHMPKPVKLALAIDGAEDIISGVFSGGLGNVLGGIIPGAAAQEQVQII